jgi:hypothetical protein
MRDLDFEHFGSLLRPEPRLEPPDDGPNCVADCKHEIVFTDDYDQMQGTSGGAYDFHGKTECPECAKVRFDEWFAMVPLKQKMGLMGSDFLTLEELLSI